MLNEDRFHNLIEEEGQDKKQAAWQKVQLQLTAEDEVPSCKAGTVPGAGTSGNGGATGNGGKAGGGNVAKGGRSAVRRYIPAFAVAAAVILAVVLIITFIAIGSKEEKPKPLTSSGEYYDAYNVSLDGYTREDAGFTLEEYAEENGADVLYFDEYEESLNWTGGGYWDYIYYDENGEIFCFKEQIYAYEFYEITIFKEDSGVDFPEGLVNKGVQTTILNGVQVYFVCGSNALYAKVNYGGYLYFIELEAYDATSDDVPQLLSPMFH